jgi:hypothetical protein
LEEKYLNHLGTKCITDYKDQDNASYQIYREETADGYEVFVAKLTKDKKISICDDVHYYDHEFVDLVVEKLQDGESVYIDDDLFDDCYIEEKLAEEYDAWQKELEENEG